MKIVVLAGGISTERDVSLMSGSKIYYALKERGHQAVLLDVFLGYEGEAEGIFDLDVDWAEKVAPIGTVAPDLETVKAMRKDGGKTLFGPNVLKICQDADIVFMGLHGDCGENGKVQGTFDLFGIRYTGTDPLSSALAMDKYLTKQLFKTSGVKTPYAYILGGSEDPKMLTFPCVVKVCSGGSSIGVYIAHNQEEYEEAVKNAYGYESVVLVEEYIKGRELTIAVVEGKPLPPVEIIPNVGFYDYKNKYQAGSTTEICPAEITAEELAKLQEAAIKAYKLLRIRTYARIDFILGEDGEFYCLEANTLPGMTPTSLVPQEAAAVGKNFGELCEWIIEISLRKYEE